MKINYVLIDFENVQPKNFELLAKHPFKVFVFAGMNQTKIPFDLASAMQELGKDAKYIKISGNGPNALDFHIAYYIGEFAANDPHANFHIVSKDTGFDPLLAHLKSKGIKAQRSNDLAEIPILRVDSATTTDEKITAIVKNLIGRGQSRPRKVKTLQNTINTLFTKKLEIHELQEVVNELQRRKYITVNDGNVTYALPKTH
ncbi:MAG: PIN domain-containing protein [Pseudohongiellaceae bacterium]